MNELQKARRFWVAPLIAFVIGLVFGPFVAPFVAGPIRRPPPVPSALGITQGLPTWVAPSPNGTFPIGASNGVFGWKWASELWPLWIANGFFFAGIAFVFLMLRDFWRLARAKQKAQEPLAK